MWATLLRCPHIHRPSRVARAISASRAHTVVTTTCRVDWDRHGTDPQLPSLASAPSPYTVLSTHAGALFHSLPFTSTCGIAWNGDCKATIFLVRALPGPSLCLPLLRPRPELLRRQLCTRGAHGGSAGSRPALSAEPPRPAESCSANCQPSRAAKECDASGFTFA